MDRRRRRRVVIVLRPGESVRFRCNGQVIVVRAANRNNNHNRNNNRDNRRRGR